ncbi:MAG: tetratricopeptide repeat protein [Phycisphaerales bacterium]|jgi:tetratricopeptide (TPR) repeat protein|nr:tetratricopeptide repeat protein [Phycisphaerales bacterium]
MDSKEVQTLVEDRRKALQRYKDQTKGVQTKIHSGSSAEIYSQCKSALTNNPWDLRVFRVLGVTASKQKEYDLAVYAFENILELEPENPKYRTELGVLYYHYGKRLQEAGDHNDAKRCFEKTKEILSDYSGKDGDIIWIIRQVDPEIAISIQAGGRDRGSLEANIGHSAELDRRDRGLEIDIEGLESKLRDSSLPKIKRLSAARQMSDYFKKSADITKALAYLEEALPLDEQSDTQKAIAVLKYEVFQKLESPSPEVLEGIKEEYAELAKKRPSDPDITLGLGQINFALGKWKQCIEAVQKNSLSRTEDMNLAEILIGNSLSKMGLHIAAELQFQTTAERTQENAGPQYVEAMYGLAMAQKEQGKQHEAEKSFSEVLRLDFNYRDALAQLTGVSENSD